MKRIGILMALVIAASVLVALPASAKCGYLTPGQCDFVEHVGWPVFGPLPNTGLLGGQGAEAASVGDPIGVRWPYTCNGHGGITVDYDARTGNGFYTIYGDVVCGEKMTRMFTLVRAEYFWFPVRIISSGWKSNTAAVSATPFDNHDFCPNGQCRGWWQIMWEVDIVLPADKWWQGGYDATECTRGDWSRLGDKRHMNCKMWAKKDVGKGVPPQS
jgi:hypothetical protein